MSAATLAPRRAPLAAAPCPGSAYVQEQRLIRTYNAQLYAADNDALLLEVFGQRLVGPLALLERGRPPRCPRPGQADPYTAQRRAYRAAFDKLDEAESRLSEDLPELIRLLSADERRAGAAQLAAGDLAGFIGYVLKLDRGNGLKKRETDPRLKPTTHDEALAKAAGLGHLSRKAYGRPQKPVAPKPAAKPAPVPQVVYLLSWNEVFAPTRAVAPPRPKPVRRPPKRRLFHGSSAAGGQLSLWP